MKLKVLTINLILTFLVSGLAHATNLTGEFQQVNAKPGDLCPSSLTVQYINGNLELSGPVALEARPQSPFTNAVFFTNIGVPAQETSSGNILQLTKTEQIGNFVTTETFTSAMNNKDNGGNKLLREVISTWRVIDDDGSAEYALEIPLSDKNAMLPTLVPVHCSFVRN